MRYRSLFINPPLFLFLFLGSAFLPPFPFRAAPHALKQRKTAISRATTDAFSPFFFLDDFFSSPPV